MPRPAAPPSSVEESNASCIPRQMPSTGVPASHALAQQLVQPQLAQALHRARERAHAGHDEAGGGPQLLVIAA